MNTKKLREAAKYLAIEGRSKMNKEQLEAAIATRTLKQNMEEIAQEQPAIETKVSTMQYADRADVGDIVAFRAIVSGKTRTLSGKIMNNNVPGPDHKLNYMTVETKYGSQYSLSSKDVLWVKTGDRWPRWVYLELKGKPQTIDQVL